MKKLSFFVLAFMAISMAFTSCKSGDDKATATDTATQIKDTAAMPMATVDTVKTDTAASKAPIVPPKE